MFMMMYVSRNIEQATDMLDVWVKSGVKGVTILESAGMQQAGEMAGIREDVGIAFSLRMLLQSQEIHHRTLFSVIETQETLDKAIQASGEYIGDWTRPDVGVLFVLPVIQAYGLAKRFGK